MILIIFLIELYNSQMDPPKKPQRVLLAIRKSITKTELSSLSKFFEVIKLVFGLEAQIRDFEAFLEQDQTAFGVITKFVSKLTRICCSEADTSSGPNFDSRLAQIQNSILANGAPDFDSLLYLLLLKLEDGAVLDIVWSRVNSKRIDFAPAKPTPATLLDPDIANTLLAGDSADPDTLRQIQIARQSIQSKRKEKRLLQDTLFREAGINMQRVDLQKLIRAPELELRDVEAKCSALARLGFSSQKQFEHWRARLQRWSGKYLRALFQDVLGFRQKKERHGSRCPLRLQ